MKKILALAAAAAMTVVSAAPANAADGCGRGYHLGRYGHCRPNYGYGPAVGIGVGPLVIGTYYNGRGYWDGRRYYQNRYRWHGGWRYR